MKNFYLLLCFLATATFSYAQELTPDMLVGEYEGTAEVLYEGSKEPLIDKKSRIIITQNDTLLSMKLFFSETDFETNIFIEKNSLKVYSKKTEDLNGLKKTTLIENYTGDKLKSVKVGSYNSEKQVIIMSFTREIRVEGRINKSTIKYFYIEMKKQ